MPSTPLTLTRVILDIAGPCGAALPPGDQRPRARGTLGLTVLFFDQLLERGAITYFVPFMVAVLLVSFGSDYNVLLVGRIWQEARKRTLSEAIAVTVPRAGRAINIAGLALALSFGLLALVPLSSFRELAFTMVAGILAEAFLVRTLLVPALLTLVGERSTWPGGRWLRRPAGRRNVSKP